MTFDFNGDGELDAIERATMQTYFDRFRSADDLDFVPDDDEYHFEGDEYLYDD